MYLDKENAFSEQQNLDSGSVVSENIIDLGSNFAGVSGPLNVFAHVDGADFNTLTSVTISLKGAATAAGVAAADNIWVGETVLLADLVDGYKFELPPIPKNCPRYVGLYYTVAGSNPTTGEISSYIVLDEQTNGYEAMV